jgi:hypothetical protein
MKKYFGSFAIAFVFLGTFAHGQAAPQSDAPRQMDKQFGADYQSGKKLSAEIAAAISNAQAKLEKENRPRQRALDGLTAELQRKIAQKCADVPQGCHYDEVLNAAIPNPKPAAAPQQNVQPPAATPAPEAKPDEKK